ncbi:MAG: YcaQ family DNA glycosylase [Candidatus Eremiobacteraeota bacterium]|nr:YcaQ family DNA glycosylase [Candidatus Eremiobacteraeota bacterium]
MKLSLREARRIAIAAQGLGKPPAGGSSRALQSVMKRLSIVQIDSVNVLVRSHYLPFFSRCGPYDRGLLERLAYRRPRRFFEYWAHEASFVPIELYPLLRWRMQRAADGRGTWKHVSEVGRKRKELVARVRGAFEERGAMSASDFEEGKGTGSWWGWSDTKRAIEYLFWAGELAVVKRRTSFERVYDLTERVIPEAILDLPDPGEAAAQRELVAIASRALGPATEADLRDYFRLDAADSKLRVAELVEGGRLQPVTVEGWKGDAYLDPSAVRVRRVEGSALLSPFDSLVWNRARTHRLFDFHYRIEIYTPRHKRVHGYYVLPYLVDGALVARVDLKAVRERSALQVQAVHFEPGADRKAVRARLESDLAQMACWLELERVRFAR